MKRTLLSLALAGTLSLAGAQAIAGIERNDSDRSGSDSSDASVQNIIIAQPPGGRPPDPEPIGEGDEPIEGQAVEGDPAGESDAPVGGPAVEGGAADQHDADEVEAIYEGI